MDKHYANPLFFSASSLGHYKKQNFWVLCDLRGKDQRSMIHIFHHNDITSKD